MTEGELHIKSVSRIQAVALCDRSWIYASMRLFEDVGAVAIPQPHTYVAVAEDKRCRAEDLVSRPGHDINHVQGYW